MNYGKINFIYNNSSIPEREHKKLYFIRIQITFNEYNQKT